MGHHKSMIMKQAATASVATPGVIVHNPTASSYNNDAE